MLEGLTEGDRKEIDKRIEKTKVGLYNKFSVHRTDGKDLPGQKHENCQYFVIDITHDPFAKSALLAYAAACQGSYPVLAEDLKERMK